MRKIMWLCNAVTGHAPLQGIITMYDTYVTMSTGKNFQEGLIGLSDDEKELKFDRLFAQLENEGIKLDQIHVEARRDNRETRDNRQVNQANTQGRGSNASQGQHSNMQTTQQGRGGNDGRGRGGRGNNRRQSTRTRNNDPNATFAQMLENPSHSYHPDAFARLNADQRTQLSNARYPNGRPDRSSTQSQAPSTQTRQTNNAQSHQPDAVPSTLFVPNETPSIAPSTTTTGTQIPAGVQQMLANNSVVTRRDTEGRAWYSASTAVTYPVQNAQANKIIGLTLVDGGANGGLCGNDMLVLKVTSNKVNISGIVDHEIADAPLLTAATKIRIADGMWITGICHQYAQVNCDKSIHAPCQIRNFGHFVDDTFAIHNGTQRMTTMCGYVIPFLVQAALPFMTTSKPPREEIDALRHVILTSDMPFIQLCSTRCTTL